MNRFKQFFAQAIAKLGLQAKLDAKELTTVEQEAVMKAYKELAGSDFLDDYKAFKEEEAKAEAAKEQAEAFKALANMFGVDTQGQIDTQAILDAIQAAKTGMEEKITKLGSQAESDEPQSRITEMEKININGAHTENYAFGVPHALFDATVRYNRIAILGRIDGEPSETDKQVFRENYTKFAESLAARVAKLAKSNGLQAVIKGEADYSLLNDPEIGTRYIVRRQDALIAQIAKLPTLKDYFPLHSNVQDGTVLTNVLFSQLTQAYQPGHITKGSYKFLPEKARVHKVMFKHAIEDMTWIEENYLGYLNTSGSDPVKWSMIEWLVLRFAEQITNEISRRNMLGYRVEPTAGEAGEGMFGAFGVLHTLINLYDEAHKVLPFFDEDLEDYDKTNILDVLEAFMDAVAERVDHPEEYIVYVNKKHLPWFKACYTSKYGTNANFTGVSYEVPNHNNRIVFLPEMDNLKFIFATKDQNIQLLENVPGEQFKMKFQQDLETVLVAAYWKEGAGVNFAGPQKTDRAELIAADAREQVIFINWPMTAVAADATTINGKTDMFFRTGVNTKETVLTDITNAKSDVIYRIEVGDATFPTKINKTGKFSELTAAWAPTAVGEYIKLYHKDGKFYDVARG